MTVEVRECPVCRARTPHEGRRGRKAFALAVPGSVLMAAVFAAAAGAWPLALALGFPAAIVLLYVGEQTWRFVACGRCRERERRAYVAAKPRLTEIDWL